ncbi:isocitrate/isopropylmalate dehydrogenase family protein [Shumkonia mesophila]|uniref:isocitrate/isopropylmalate dehydrogenase family protein n=1 Tax=Shumkonia mesophila TaxID=2838854 RepID=UPI002934A147|nr:isocitrate/isopropylmalate family dehydrogenase [Shumkonia mesophila]
MKILSLPGDDIGPEITAGALLSVDSANSLFNLGLEIVTREVGMASHRNSGTTMPESVVQEALAADGVIMGPAGITNYPSIADGGINVPATIRKRLDLFANVRPFKARHGIPDARPGLDLVFVRENTEGFYSDRTMFAGCGEFMPTPDVALSVRKITAQGSRRVAEYAFQLAAKRRRKVTAIGKEHVLKLTDGLFMGEARKIAAQCPDIEFGEMDVDAFAASIYSRPAQFDVIVITNMFGDILSNLGAAMAGGLGLAGALNVGKDHAAANAGHGSAPDIAGKDCANPSGLIASCAMLLEWLGERSQRSELVAAGKSVQRALDDILTGAPASRTGDLGGAAGTRAFSQAVAARVSTAGL